MNPSRAFPVLSIVLTAALFSGCGDGSSPSADFPDAVGSRWTYAVYDSLTATPDTVEVEVVGETRITIGEQRIPATVWRLTASDPATLGGSDYRYVVREDGTVEVWAGDADGVHWLEFRYVFPLEVGDEWALPPCPGDTAYVTESQPLPLPGAAARTAFRIQRPRGGCLNDYVQEERWFAPDVGLVRGWYREFGFGFGNRSWELIGFDLAK